MIAAPIPVEIKLLQKSRMLEIVFDNDERFVLSCEFLRVHSPSAEVQGHGGKGGELPRDKKQVNILSIEPVGQYAIKLIFDDGHRTGLYSWEYLYNLATHQTELWKEYLHKLNLT